MLILRKILFYLFALIYIIFCPLIILYALGFIFKTDTQKIVKTGLIHISTIPPGATVSLDEKWLEEKTTTTIRNLSPGRYSLKLTLENYLPWEKIIPVKAEEASKLENLILIPHSWRTKTLSSLWFEGMTPIEGTSLFLLHRGPTLKDIFIYRFRETLDEKIFADTTNNASKSEPLPLFAPNFIYAEATLVRTFKIKSSAYVIFQVSIKNENKFLFIDLKNDSPKVEDITNLFLEPTREILWENQDDRNLFILQKENLHRVDVVAQAIFPKVVENARGWGLANKKLYFLSENYELNRMDYDGKNSQIVNSDRRLMEALSSQKEFFKIVPEHEDTIFFLGSAGSWIFNHPPFLLTDRGIKGFVFDREEKQLAVWTDRQIGIVHLEKIKTTKDDSPQEAYPSIEWVMKTGQRIEQVFWANNNSYLIYLDKNKIYLLGLETFDPLSVNEILPVKENTSFYYDDKQEKLYYLDRQTQCLSAIDIIPGKPLISIPRIEDKEKIK